MAKGRQFPVREGSPFPRGASWDGMGTNFALFSANATKVEVCLFDSTGDTEIARVELPDQPDLPWIPATGQTRRLLWISRPRPL
jgi:glycogen operon protein